VAVSAQALQRVVVRMLFDPAFRLRVYADSAAALQDVEITAEERQWLLTPPPQAYGTDIHRRSRTLSGVLEEYPVAGALAVRGHHGLARLQGFFASAFFHQCVQQRGSLAEAFGGYLQADVFADQPEIARLAVIELSIVRVRRAADIPPVSASGTEARVRLAPWVELLSVPSTALPRYSTVLRRLRQHRGSLLGAVLDPTYRLPAGPSIHNGATEWVLVVGVPGGDGPSLEPTSQELGALLSAAQQERTFGALCAVAVCLGATPEEVTGILEELLADQLLIRVS
jgi:hypothetical protein